MRRLAPMLLVLLGCSKPDAPSPPPAATATATASATSTSTSTASAVPRGAVVPSTVAYETYVNPRFGFSVEYPTFLTKEPPPLNGDGQAFTSGNAITMTASGIHALGDTVAKRFASESAQPGVTFKKKLADGFVISGTNEGRIFYEKTIVSKDIAYTLLLEYDAMLKTPMDPVVTHVASTFHVTGGVGP